MKYKKYNLSIILIASLPIRKMKSIGNISLLSFKNKNILEWQIKNIYKYYTKPEIIVVGAFEAKKLEKTLIKYPDIKYIVHDLDELSNESQSIKIAISNITTDKCLIWPINTLCHEYIKPKKNNESYIIINNHKTYKNDIGCTIDIDNNISYIFYNLENYIINTYYLTNYHINILKNLDDSYGRLYLFELMNLLNTNVQKLKPYFINQKKCCIIDSVSDYIKATEIF